MAKKKKTNKQQQRQQRRQQRQQKRQQLISAPPLTPPKEDQPVVHQPTPNPERPLAAVLKALSGDKAIDVRTNVIGRLNKAYEDMLQAASRIDVVAERDELKSKHQDELEDVAEFIRDAAVIWQTGVRDVLVAHGRAVFATAQVANRNYDVLISNLQKVMLQSNEAETKDLLDQIMKDLDIRRNEADATQAVYKTMGLVPSLDADA